MDINNKPTVSSVNDSDYVLISKSSAVKRFSFTNLVNYLKTKLLPLTGGTLSGDIVINKTSPVVQLNASNIAGRLVASDTSNNFGLWDVTHSKYVISVNANGIVHIPPVNVKDSITLTRGQNCAAVTLNNAYRIGNVLFIKFQVTPVSGLNPADNVDIAFSGFTPAITSDYRLSAGIIGVGLYMSWITSATTIRCRYMSSNAWSNSNTPIFTGVIPVTTS